MITRTIQFDYRCTCGHVGRVQTGKHQSAARLLELAVEAQRLHGCLNTPDNALQIANPGRFGPLTNSTIVGYVRRHRRWVLTQWNQPA